jgi:hypothetical protein
MFALNSKIIKTKIRRGKIISPKLCAINSHIIFLPSALVLCNRSSNNIQVELNIAKAVYYIKWLVQSRDFEINFKQLHI